MNKKNNHNKNLKLLIASLFLVGSLIGLLLNDDEHVYAFHDEEIITTIPVGVNNDNVKAILTKDGTLTLSGEGEIKGFTADTTPLKEYRNQISQIVIEDGITSIGDYLFYNCKGLNDALEIPATVVHIGDGAFYGSDEKNAPHFMKIINHFKTADITVAVEKEVASTEEEQTEKQEPANSESNDPMSNNTTPVDDNETDIKEPASIKTETVIEIKTITEQQMGTHVFYATGHGGYQCEDNNASFVNAMNEAEYQKADRFVTAKLDNVLTRNLPVFKGSIFVPEQPETGLTNPSMDDALHESIFTGWTYQGKEVTVDDQMAIDETVDTLSLTSRWETKATLEPEIRQSVKDKKTIYSIFNKITDTEIADIQGYVMSYQWQIKTLDSDWKDIEGETKSTLIRESNENDNTSLFRAILSVSKQSKARTAATPTTFTTNEVTGIDAEKPITITYDANGGVGEAPVNTSISISAPYKPEESTLTPPNNQVFIGWKVTLNNIVVTKNNGTIVNTDDIIQTSDVLSLSLNGADHGNIIFTAQWSNGTVIYFNPNISASGDGMTPDTAVKTLNEAYGKLPSDGTINTNKIVLLGSYRFTSTVTLPAKKATIAANSYDQTTSPILFIDNTNVMITLGDDTKFENIKIGAPTFWSGNSERPEGIYADFHTLIMGDHIVNTSGTLQVFGGSRTSGKNGNSDIRIFSGSYRYINGAGYNTSSSGNTNILLYGGGGAVYGGIHVGGVLTGSTNITAYGGGFSIFGGNRYGQVTGDTHIKIYGGGHSVFGASHAGTGYVKNVNIEVYDPYGTTKLGEFCGGIYDGNSTSNRYPVQEKINISIHGGTFGAIYGGGLNDWADGSGPTVKSGVKLLIENAEVNNDVYLGGKYGAVNGSSTLTIRNSNIHGSVYGGGLGGKNNKGSIISSNIYGNATINIDEKTIIDNNVYGGGNNRSNINSTALIYFYGTAKNVYGSGKGSLTSVSQSNINIGDNAVIKENVYGGGDEGTTTASTLNILGGVIGTEENSGNIFGGGNNVGVNTSIVSLKNTPTITGNIYGGSNASGTTTTSTVNISGSVANSVYAGGKGENTTVTNATLNVESGANIAENAFGGSEKGAVTNSTVNLNGGYVKNAFGGSDQASITGDVKITSLAGSSAGNIYAGCNSSGSVSSPILNLAGKADNVFGGGNATDKTQADVTGVSTITVTSDNANKISNVYGGANSSGLVKAPVINIKGYAGNVYGGGYGADTTTESPSITTQNATVDNAYGGGNKGLVTNTNVLISSDSNIKNAFAGGNEAGVDGTVKIQATSTATIQNMYGGSNNNGTVKNPQIQVDGSEGSIPKVTNVYGGGYGQSTVTESPVIKIDSYTTIENVYGGGNLGQTSNASITVGNTNNGTDTGTIDKVFAGGDQAGITGKSNVVINPSMKVTSLYGGSNNSGDVEDVDLTINGTVGTVYGGGLGNGTKTYTPVIIVNNGAKITNLYGGGDEGRTFTSSHITLKEGSVVNENVYGAGNQIGIEDKQNAGIGNAPESDSYITVDEGATVQGNLYGGSNQRGTVKGVSNLTINGIVTGNVFGGGKGVNTQVFNTKINMSATATAKNVYGGSEEGSIEDSTLIEIQGSKIAESVYGAGFGATSNVKKDVYIVIADASINGNVFGGGSQGTVGGDTHVDIISGTIGTASNKDTGNVFGGSDSAIVSGNTKVHVGKFAADGNTVGITPTSKEITIMQSIFGGGNKAASGTSFDASNPYVLGDAEVNVDAETYTTFKVGDNLFGDGNKCVVSGNRTFILKNYDATLLSIQRADTLTIEKSKIEITGTTDSANLIATSKYSLNRIGNLILKDGSEVKLQTPANLLLGIESQDATGNVTTASNALTINNTIYIQQGEALELRTNEDVSRPGYGDVKGFTLLGRFDKDGNSLEKGIYILGGVGSDNDSGFYYANTTDADQGITQHEKITPTYDKEGKVWRNWKVANVLLTRKETLTMSDKPTGGKTAQLEGDSADGSIYRLDTSSLQIRTQNGSSEKFTIKEEGQLKASDNVNTTLGLSISTGQNGWLEQRKAGYIVGDSDGVGNQIIVDETNKGEMRSINGGTAKPIIQVDLSNLDGVSTTDSSAPLQVTFTINMIKLQPDGSEIETGKMNITLDIIREQHQQYTDVALQSGKKYDRAGQTYTYNSASPQVGITISKESSVTLQYAQQGQLKNIPSNHTLTFSTALPEGTTILMVDKKGTHDEYYEYIVPAGGKSKINLSDFIKNETANTQYQPVREKGQKENFIFVINFAQATTFTANSITATLDAVSSSGSSEYNATMSTVFAVNGDKKEYSLSSEKASGTVSITPDYPMNTTFQIDLKTAVQNANVGIDTTGDGRQMGVKVKLFNKDLNRYIDIPQTWKIISNGVRYSTSGDSLTVVLADQMTEATSNIYISMDNLSNVPSGNYRFDIELVSGALANYPGDTTTTSVSNVKYNFKLKDYRYSIAVEMLSPDEPIFKTDDADRTINALITKVAQGGADTSEVTVEQVVSRKNPETKKYEDVNLSDVFTGNLDKVLSWKTNKQTYKLKDGLEAGTYRITYTIKTKVEINGTTVVKDAGTETMNFIVTKD